MPSLSQATAPAMSRADGGGGSNLPQLKEGQLFAAELPDRGMSDRSDRFGGGPSSHAAHAPVPAPRGAGGSKKKASAYDPSNPYFSKPPSKSKQGKSKGSSSLSHALRQSDGGSSSFGGGAGAMGVVGQGHAIQGLAAAYSGHAQAPSSLPPRTPNHDYDHGPPRTPGESAANHYEVRGRSSQQPFLVACRRRTERRVRPRTLASCVGPLRARALMPSDAE